MVAVNHVRRKVIIVGAGGHARVVSAILGKDLDVDLVGVADRSAATLGEAIGPTKIITTFEELPSYLDRGVSCAALAIGDNRERLKLGGWLRSVGFSLLKICHPSAIVEADVCIGEGAVICAGAIICAGVIIHDGAIINTGAIIDHETDVGAYAHVGPGSCIAGRVKIGERVFVGAGSRIIHQIRIGADSVIGAGSVVVDDVPDSIVTYGIPAKTRRHV